MLAFVDSPPFPNNHSHLCWPHTGIFISLVLVLLNPLFALIIVLLLVTILSFILFSLLYIILCSLILLVKYLRMFLLKNVWSICFFFFFGGGV